MRIAPICLMLVGLACQRAPVARTAPGRHVEAVIVPQLGPYGFTDVALAADGRLLAAIDNDLVIVAEVAGGQQLAHLAGRAVRFTADGGGLFVLRTNAVTRLSLPDLRVTAELAAAFDSFEIDRAGATVVGIRAGKLGVWEVATGQRRCEVEGPEIDELLAVASAGTRAWTCHADQLAAWDTRDCRRLAVATLAGKCQALAVNPDATRLVVNTRSPGEELTFPGTPMPDRSELWDAVGLTQLRSQAQLGAFNKLLFTPDGNTVLSPERFGGGVLEWDTGSGAVRALRFAMPLEVETMAFSADGARLIVLGHPYPDPKMNRRRSPAQVRVWSWPGGAVVGELTRELDGVWPSLALAHGRSFYAFDIESDEDGLRSTATWELLRRLPHDPAEDAALAPDGDSLASARGSRITLTDARTGYQRGSFTVDLPVVDHLMFSDDGARLLVVGVDGTHILVDPAGLRELRRFTGSAFDPRGYRPARGADLASDGTHLLILHDDHVAVWDAATGERRWTAPPGATWIEAPWSGDGRRVALQIGERFTVHDTRSGAVLGELHGLDEPVLSHDGARVAGRDEDGALRLYDVASGAVQATLITGDAVGQHRVLDGSIVASDGTTTGAWDPATGARVAEITGPTGHVVRLRDGRWMATHVRVLSIHASTGELQGARMQLRDGAWAAWAPGGRWDAGGGGERLLRAVDRLTVRELGPRTPDLWLHIVAASP